MADYMLVLILQKQLGLLRLLQQNLLLLYYWLSSSRVMGLVCKQCVTFIRMLHGFSNGFSVVVWRRHSATYRPGIYTTAFWVVSSESVRKEDISGKNIVFPEIFFKTTAFWVRLHTPVDGPWNRCLGYHQDKSQWRSISSLRRFNPKLNISSHGDLAG